MEKLVEEKINKIIDTNLIGVIEVIYTDDEYVINTVSLPGVMIDSTLILTPNHTVFDLIKNKNNTIIRFLIGFTEFDGKYFVDAIDEMHQVELFPKLEMNLRSVWKIIVLKYNIGEFLQKRNNFYYSVENLNCQNKQGDNLIFGQICYRSDNDASMSYSMIKECFHWEDKIYINFDFVSISNGILFSGLKKIIGIFIEKTNRILTVNQLEKLIKEKSSSDNFIRDFNTYFKRNLGEDSKLIEINKFTTNAIKSFSICLKNYTKESIIHNGLDSTLSSYFNHFRKYFLSWDRLKTLIAVGPKLIEKLCKQFKINSSTINVYLLTQIIITQNKINIDSNDEIRKYLDLSGLTVEYPHISTVIYSFYYDNLVYIDLTNIKFDSSITKILANFLYKNCSLRSLILERTGIQSSHLFQVITAIRQSKNKSFSTLNVSHNNFYEENYECEIMLENSDLFLLCRELSKIHSLEELIMTDVRPQSHISRMFRLMHESFKNSKIKVLGDSECKISLKKLNLSNVHLSNPLSNQEYFTPISDFIYANSAIEEIYLPYCNLGDEDVIRLLKSLLRRERNFPQSDKALDIKYLKILDLSGNLITAKSAEYIKNYLKLLTKKEKISNGKFSESIDEFNSDNSSHNNPEILNSSIKGFKNLITNEDGFSLYLNNIPMLEPEGVGIICEGITGLSIDIHLHLDNIRINKEGLDALYNTIKIGNSLKSLSLALNNLNDYDIETNFIEIFSDYNNFCYLSSLDLHGNKISKEKILTLLNYTQNYARYKNVKPCNVICDPINFSYLKYLNKDKKSNELTQGNSLNTNHETFDANINLIKNLSFYSKKSKIKNKYNTKTKY